MRREGDGGVIEKVLSRRSMFVRKAAGQAARPQLIAANLDRVLIVTAVDNDFNVRRLERYLAVVWDGGAEPAIVVNKTDLDHDRAALAEALEPVAMGATVVWCSAVEDGGLDEVLSLCGPGLTVAFVCSSGVGKSTMINRLMGEKRQAVAPVREGDRKGRHTTSSRELFVTPGGAILIDTPGLRELGLWDAEDGLQRAFADIEELARNCRFRDCSHAGEPGCAVAAAVKQGSLDPSRLEGYLRLQRELEHINRRATQGGVNAKARWKDISRSVRNMYKLNKDLGLKGK
jgi:ribosome biogenesis GTPase